MSTPTLDPTRKQLDDLDVLLQRMLALPVNGNETERHAPIASRTSPPAPAVGPAVTYSYTDSTVTQPMTFSAPPATPPVAQAPVAAAPVRSPEPSWTVPLPGVANGPSVLSWSNGFENLARKNSVPPSPPPANEPTAAFPKPSATQIPMPASPEQRLRIEPFSAPQAQATAMAASLAVRDAGSDLKHAPTPAVLWPLHAIDWCFGNLLAGFGPAGRWLGKGGGKILLGLAGLLMIGGAIAWAVMDYFGWSW